MADDSNTNVPSQGPNASSREVITGVKPPTSWALPLITAVVLASAFCLYYFVYVQAQREYLANRNFRSLAMLGDQIQAMVSIHGSILEFIADLAERKNQDLKQRLCKVPGARFRVDNSQETLKAGVQIGCATA